MTPPQVFLGETKEVLSAAAITALWAGRYGEAHRMAMYSLREAELALRLLDKLQIITETLEMARVSFSHLTFQIDVCCQSASWWPCVGFSLLPESCWGSFVQILDQICTEQADGPWKTSWTHWRWPEQASDPNPFCFPCFAMSSLTYCYSSWIVLSFSVV